MGSDHNRSAEWYIITCHWHVNTDQYNLSFNQCAANLPKTRPFSGQASMLDLKAFGESAAGVCYEVGCCSTSMLLMGRNYSCRFQFWNGGCEVWSNGHGLGFRWRWEFPLWVWCQADHVKPGNVVTLSEVRRALGIWGSSLSWFTRAEAMVSILTSVLATQHLLLFFMPF